MFQFPGCPSPGLCIQPGDAAGSPQRVSPFGNPRINACSRLPESLSQCPTSFIGTWRQGIHRKPLVASPRDAEKLILFGLHQKLSIQINNYSVVKVLFSPLTGDRCASHLSSTRIGSQLFFSTKRPGSSPGRVVLPLRSEPTFYLTCQGRQLQTFRHPFIHRLSGDDGIRTRGLRLAKALLSR